MTSTQFALILTAFGVLFLPLLGLAWRFGALVQKVANLDEKVTALFTAKKAQRDDHDALKARIDAHLGRPNGGG